MNGLLLEEVKQQKVATNFNGTGGQNTDGLYQSILSLGVVVPMTMHICTLTLVWEQAIGINHYENATVHPTKTEKLLELIH